MPTDSNNIKRNNEIADLYATGKYTYESIGQIYGITRQAVEQVITSFLVKSTGKTKKKISLRLRNAKIINMAKSGISREEIAKDFGLSLTIIANAIRNSPVDTPKPPHGNKIKKETIEEIEKLYATGQYSYAKLQNMFNICIDTIMKSISKEAREEGRRNKKYSSHKNN